MILRSTVRLDLRYAAQDRHRPACRPKSLRRLVYVFRLSSFLLFYVLPTLSYASTVREALPRTIYDPRLRFTVLRTRLSIASELPRYTTVHRSLQDFSSVRTPEGLVHKTFGGASSVAVLSQSRAFGYQTTEAVRKAASRHRRRQFHKGADLTHSVLIEAKRSALEDQKGDTQMLENFHGGVHDISVFDTGELRSGTIYWNLGLDVLATEIRQNPNAKIAMDCNGSLVQDV